MSKRPEAAGSGPEGAAAIRVLVADDQEIARTGLRMILDAQPGIEVVGEAGDGRRAVELARRLRPDVCLFDIRMPGLDGIAATRELAGPDVADPMAVVVITTFDLDEYVYAALRAGARGFLLKDAGPALLAQAVTAAAGGEALIAPSVTARLLAAFAGAGRTEAPAQPVEALTGREEEILRAVARGRTNSEIARELHISLSTVKSHVASLMTKLGVRNRVEIAMWAYETDRVRT
ncbi:response regulator transcription factor [Nonomuraea sp. NPDC049637]|uniref:response regulator transcription factor n=1 Tax=Nonomuraea sp. NPDC049637 TaxID=3154356 RepID=UPI00343F9BA3